MTGEKRTRATATVAAILQASTSARRSTANMARKLWIVLTLREGLAKKKSLLIVFNAGIQSIYLFAIQKKEENTLSRTESVIS